MVSEIKEDEEVTKKVKQELENDRIDISMPQFYSFSKYQKYRIKYLTNKGYEFLSYDYYIEKVILKNKDIKKGKYDIGTKYNLKKDDLKYDKLYWEIVDEEHEKFEQGKRMETATYSSVKSKFTESASKGGLINQLKNIIGTDLKEFDRLEVLKLLKLLYRFSKDNYYGQKINLMLMFKKPSLENIDKTSIGETNMNGEMMAILKGELIKELNLSKVRQINEELFKIINAWEKLLQVAAMYVLGCNKLDLERLATFIEKIIIPKLPSSDTINSDYRYSLFEIFYLKTLEYEYISKANDFININEANLAKIDKNKLQAKKYTNVSDMENKYIEESSLEIGIKNQMAFLVMYVFAEDINKISDVKKAFILDNIKPIEILIGWVEKYTTCELNGKIPWLLVIAAYQALDDVIKNGEIFKYSYYRAPVSGQIEIITKVINGNTSEEAFHWLWVKKVDFIFKCLSDRKDEARFQIQIEKGFDTIMSFIMMYNNIQDMSDVHNFLFSMFKRSFILSEYAKQEANRVADEVNRLTRYKIEVYHQNVENLFKDMWGTFDSGLIYIFCKLIEMVECREIESVFCLPIKGVQKNGQNKDSILDMEIVSDKKVIKLKQFHNVLSDEECERYKKLGLEKFIR